MPFIITILIFIILFILYLHLVSHYRKSEDLEIYEMDYIHNKGLNDVCERKQPVLFQMEEIYPEFFEQMAPHLVISSTINEVKMKDMEDYWRTPEDVQYIDLKIQTALQLMATDTKSHYITENNNGFVEEGGEMYDLYYGMNRYLKPGFVINTKYDLCMGSKGAVTPLRYHTIYRQFMALTHGRIRVKMTCWKSRKYLYPINDYSEYEFKSPINVWNPQKKYKKEYDKVRFIEFDMTPGYVLHIPSYWWWSIQYLEENSVVAGFMYNTPLNVVANAGDWAKYYIQQFNTEHKVAPVLDPNQMKAIDNGDFKKEPDPPTNVEKLLLLTDNSVGSSAVPSIEKSNNNDSIEVSIDGKIIV